MKNNFIKGLFITTCLSGCSNPQAATQSSRVPDAYKICDNVSLDFSCAQKVEKEFLKIYSDLATKTDEHKLSLKLKNGSIKTYTDVLSEDYSTAVSYSFIGYPDGLNYYVLRLQYYEGCGFILVDQNDGKEYAVADLPVMSPDKKTFACVHADVAAKYNSNAIQIWHILEGRLVLAYELNPKQWGPSSAIWKDRDHLEITSVKYDWNNFKEVKLPNQTVSLTNGRWTIN